MAGAFQLLEALTATFGEVIVLGRLVIAGNAAAHRDGCERSTMEGASQRSRGMVIASGKDADPDILILKEAKAEYAKLQ
jgi:hypothetical protein